MSSYQHHQHHLGTCEKCKFGPPLTRPKSDTLEVRPTIYVLMCLLHYSDTHLRLIVTNLKQGFPGSSDIKESAYNAGDLGSIPGLGRSPGGGNGNPLQFLAWRTPWTEKEASSSITGVKGVSVEGGIEDHRE